MTALAHTLPRTWTTDLAALLRVDAALCAVTGLLAAVAPGTVADALGPDVPSAAVRWSGVALVVGGLGVLQLRALRRSV